MSQGVVITGYDEIDKLLKQLPSQLQHKILSEAHAEAARPLVDRAQSKAPEKTGNLSRSIGVKKFNVQKVAQIGLVQVGPLRGGGRKGYHGHLIEYGHAIVTRSGQLKGFVKERPFMGPAYNETKDIVERNIAANIGKRLLSFMKRTIKKYA